MRGRVFRHGESPRFAIGFLEDDEKFWRVVIKVTKDQSETYLTSYSRAGARHLASAVRDLNLIVKGGE